MQQRKTLRLKASPDSVSYHPNIELLNAPTPSRRFVGWEWTTVETLDDQGRLQVRHGFKRKSEAETVTFHNDYVQAVRAGDLIACDQESADLCGVPFIASK